MTVSATSRQLDLLRYIHGYQVAHGGVSPKFLECAAALGVASKSNVHRMLGALEQRGLIRRRHRRESAIEILVPPAIPMIGDQPLYLVPLGPPVSEALVRANMVHEITEGLEAEAA
jgi:SOS-response transcriptional repressor LexA